MTIVCINCGFRYSLRWPTVLAYAVDSASLDDDFAQKRPPFVTVICFLRVSQVSLSVARPALAWLLTCICNAWRLGLERYLPRWGRSLANE